MAAAEAWKTQFRQLVTEAEELCGRLIGQKIVYARGTSRTRCTQPRPMTC
jgi:hypothetical protein